MAGCIHPVQVPLFLPALPGPHTLPCLHLWSRCLPPPASLLPQRILCPQGSWKGIASYHLLLKQYLILLYCPWTCCHTFTLLTLMPGQLCPWILGFPHLPVFSLKCFFLSGATVLSSFALAFYVTLPLPLVYWFLLKISLSKNGINLKQYQGNNCRRYGIWWNGDRSTKWCV